MAHVNNIVIEDEDAYLRGRARNMTRNAMNTHNKRLAAEPEFRALIQFVETRAERGNSFFKSMVAAIEKYGKLSEKQEATCSRIMSEEAAKLAEIRARDAGSQFVGSIKERRMFTLEITGFKVMTNDYDGSEDGFFHAMKDANGNVLVYRGSVKLGEKGETVTFKATVKSHYDGKGVKTTYLNRPVLA